jgi:hypothetical protein
MTKASFRFIVAEHPLGAGLVAEDCMRKNLVLSKAADAVSNRERSTGWDVDIWKSESGFECWVADARGGNPLVCRPLKSLAVSSIVEVLEGVIRDFGLPSGIRTDSGTEFMGREFRGFLASHGIAHQVATAGAVRGFREARLRRATRAAR